ncbi:MAG: N-acetylmuramoyl-L-alanine amidase [Clostridiales bacterium]|nr:N-acetylmuramoyl-L-alanine amidase [Clostridiales bacterium]
MKTENLKEGIQLTWSKIKKADGYEIQYAGNSRFKNASSVYVKGALKNSKKLSEISKKKNTYIRVRAYKSGSKNKKEKKYSPWSNSIQLIAWNAKWKYAGNSQIHEDVAVLYYSGKIHKKDKIVCINAGHGTKGGSAKKTLCHPDGSRKVTGGSTAAGSVYATAINEGTKMLDSTAEAAVNLKVAKKIRNKLLKEGYDVLMIRDSSDVQLDNVARTVLANQYADCHISIHYDSTTNNKGAFYISVPNVSSYRKMDPVASMWKKHHQLGENLITGMEKYGLRIYGSGNMPIDLTQTSYSSIPSVDLEVGDRASSYNSKEVSKIAKGIVYGVNEFLR